MDENNESLVPLNLVINKVDISKMKIKEYDSFISEHLKKYDYQVTNGNKEQAATDKAVLNKLEKALSDSRKEHFREYEEKKKELIAVEKKVKAMSNRLKDGINALKLEEKTTIEKVVKNEPELTMTATFVGTKDFFNELDALVEKHNAKMQVKID